MQPFIIARAAQHTRRTIGLAACTACAALAAGALAAQQEPAPPAAAASAPLNVAAASQALPEVSVQGHYDTAVGTSDAASEGTVTSKLIERRPTLRTAEVLEFVPGMIVTQHSGDGKANQYFLRGFNLDHGTDFATFVDGMPVNMPTHAHGQGYTDLNFLVPELVSRIRYRKGTYYAEEGDFASAGSARIEFVDALPRGLASVTLGEHAYGRALLANSSPLAGGQLLYALDLAHNDGPWVNPEKFHRSNGILRWSMADGETHQSITAMAYDAGWNATDQIPQRAVTQGLVDRFGAIDPTDGGQTSRYSLSWRLDRMLDDGSLRASAYAIRSSLDLFSDFTYFLHDPVNGDQFEQAEQRRVFGGSLARSWNGTLAGRDTTTTVGAQVRHDRLDPVGLYATVARLRTATTQEARVRETSLGLWVENATQWTPWLRSLAGLRADGYDFDVSSSIEANSGRRRAGIASPKLSLVFGPWNRTEYFVNAGYGFHSNDARGVTAAVDPADPLVRSKGAEVGVRTGIVPGLQSSLALWQLRLGSELVFAGDAGTTEASRASKRTGVEWNNHWVVNPHVLLDLDLAWSRARFTGTDPNVPPLGDYIPGSIEKVASFGVTLQDWGPWFGEFQLRYFGPRPLIEDDSQRSLSTTLAALRAGYRLGRDMTLTLDVFNLFDRKGSDIDYYYTSRLKGEAQGVDDIHFHPVEPRSVRLTLTARF